LGICTSYYGLLFCLANNSISRTMLIILNAFTGFMFCVCVCVCVCVFFFLIKNFIKHHAFLAIMFHVFKFLFPLNTMHLRSSCFMISIYLFIYSFECHAFVIFMFHGFYLFIYLIPSFEHHAFEVVDPIHDTIDSFYLDARLMTMPSVIIGVRIFYVISRFFFGSASFFLFFSFFLRKNLVKHVFFQQKFITLAKKKLKWIKREKNAKGLRKYSPYLLAHLWIN